MSRFPPFYVLAAVAVTVGVLAVGVPTSSLWILGLVVLCPLTMMVMMGGMPSSGRDDEGGDPRGRGEVREERGSRFWLGR